MSKRGRKVLLMTTSVGKDGPVSDFVKSPEGYADGTEIGARRWSDRLGVLRLTKNRNLHRKAVEQATLRALGAW